MQPLYFFLLFLLPSFFFYATSFLFLSSGLLLSGFRSYPLGLSSCYLGPVKYLAPSPELDLFVYSGFWFRFWCDPDIKKRRNIFYSFSNFIVIFFPQWGQMLFAGVVWSSGASLIPNRISDGSTFRASANLTTVVKDGNSLFAIRLKLTTFIPSISAKSFICRPFSLQIRLTFNVKLIFIKSVKNKVSGKGKNLHK